MDIEEKVSEIKEKVHNNQGKTIFCFRKFSRSEGMGPCHTSLSWDSHHYNAGIINGELINGGLNEDGKILRIDIPTFSLERDNDYYTLFGKFSIPVKRKLSGFLTLTNSFHFDKEDLENIHDGDIFFNDLELIPQSYWVNHKSILTDFSLLIGDDEVNNFFKERKIKSEQFFETLYLPEEVEKKIAIANYKEKENFGDELVKSVNKLTTTFDQIKGIESDVLRARYIVEKDQDCVNRYWDNNGEVCTYLDLRNIIRKQISNINTQLDKGSSYYPSGTDLPLIKGHEIGFPGMVTFLAYKNWLDEKISEMKNTFDKIDSYLREGEKR